MVVVRSTTRGGRRLKRDGNPLLDMVRAVDPKIDEARFHDTLTVNLRRGRFLLLIVGDGIREGVEAIAEYLQLHAGLHFSLGLVELPIYVMPNGDRLVAPRVLARSALVTRNVVAVPDGYVIDEAEDSMSIAEIDPERTALGDQSQRFWTEFLDNYISSMIWNNRSQGQRGWATSPFPFRRAPAGSQSIVP